MLNDEHELKWMPMAQPVRRILLLSKHFPPSDEVGALRWQKFAALAPRHGFFVDAVSLEPTELRRRDDRRNTDLPSGTRSIGASSTTTIFDAFEKVVNRGLMAARFSKRGASAPNSLVKALAGHPGSVARGEAMAPWTSLSSARRAYHAVAARARELAWAKSAAKVARSEFDNSRPCAVISCGPPHQIHLTARALAAAWKVPFVMDLRDPWSLVERIPEAQGSRLLWTMALKDERRCVRDASLIVLNTEAHRRALGLLHLEAAGRMIAVLNGFDDDPIPSPQVNEAFTIVYAGTIYLDRDPSALIEAFAKVVAHRNLGPSEIRLVFVGDAEGQGKSLDSVAADAGIANHVMVLGRLPRIDSLALVAAADMTVVLHQDSHLAVPSKVYEYLRFRSSVLALATRNSAVYETLNGSGAEVVPPDDVDLIANAIERSLDAKGTHGRPVPLAERATKLSRANQAARLFNEIGRILEASEDPTPKVSRV